MAKKSRPAAKRRRAKHLRLSRVAYGLILLAVLLTGAAVYLFFFCRVEAISVKGDSPYSEQEILAAGGLGKGDILVTDLIGQAKFAKKIEASLPYVEDVRLTYALPFGIVVNVTMDGAAYLVQYSGGYAVLDSGYKVLETAANASNFSSVPVIAGVDLENPVPGGTVSGEAARQLDTAKEILSGLEQYSLANINSIDVSNKYEIKAMYEGRIEILIGTDSDLDTKLKFATYLLQNGKDITSTDKGTLDVSQSAESNRASFLPS